MVEIIVCPVERMVLLMKKITHRATEKKSNTEGMQCSNTTLLSV